MSEHAVIVHFAYGQVDLDPLFEIEEKLTEAIDAAGVGEFDGNDVAGDGSNGRFYMYGPDGDKLLKVVVPVLESAQCIREVVAQVRYGPPEDGVEERAVKIGP